VSLADGLKPTTGNPGSVAASSGEGDVNLRIPGLTADRARPADNGPRRKQVESEVATARYETEERFREIDRNYAREVCMLHRFWIEDIDAEIKAEVPPTAVPGRDLFGAYTSTLANPPTVLVFMTMFAGLGLAQAGGSYISARPPGRCC
jgi:hypothetical protein